MNFSADVDLNVFRNMNYSMIEGPIQVPLISDEIRIWVERIFYSVLFLICSLGVITNAINIRVFVNQGLSSNSSTISLFSLAVSDFGSCFTLMPLFVCTVFDFAQQMGAQWSCYNIVEVPGQYTHLAFARLTSWITAYLSVERGLSIIMPLKVKTFFRPKMTATIIVSLVLIIIVIHFANPLVTIVWQYNQFFNATVAESFPSPEFVQGMYVQSFLFEAVSPCLVISFVVPSFVLMVITLRKSRKFRQTSSSSCPQTDDSKDTRRKTKDNEILKTITIVWGVYLFCQTMNFIPSIVSAIIPGVYMRDVNENVLYVSYIYKFIFDAINSSSNMFIYITVSSTFKASFQRVFFTKEQLNPSSA